VTLLCYSYWIRERGRTGHSGLRESRFDLLDFRNGQLVNALLVVTLAFFLYLGLHEIAGLL
jgi:hypothetical protein